MGLLCYPRKIRVRRSDQVSTLRFCRLSTRQAISDEVSESLILLRFFLIAPFNHSLCKFGVFRGQLGYSSLGFRCIIPSSNSDQSLQLVGILRCFTTERLKIHKEVTTEVDQYPSLDYGTLFNLEKYKPARLLLVKTEEDRSI